MGPKHCPPACSFLFYCASFKTGSYPPAWRTYLVDDGICNAQRDWFSWVFEWLVNLGDGTLPTSASRISSQGKTNTRWWARLPTPQWGEAGEEVDDILINGRYFGNIHPNTDGLHGLCRAWQPKKFSVPHMITRLLGYFNPLPRPNYDSS